MTLGPAERTEVRAGGAEAAQAEAAQAEAAQAEAAQAEAARAGAAAGAAQADRQGPRAAQAVTNPVVAAAA